MRRRHSHSSNSPGGNTAKRTTIDFEDGHKRVRCYLDGVLVADTIRPRLVWEVPSYPTYYFPESDVTPGMLEPSDTREKSPGRGEAHFFGLKGANRLVADAAYTYPDSPTTALRGYVAFVWSKLGQWFEEDEQVHVHARDPYTRVDILPSSRHVHVEIAGHTVADSHHPRLLFETGVPTRYYLAKADLAMEKLTPTAHTTSCPYKGTAEYWSVDLEGVVFENVAWSYRHPAAESERIAGLIAFSNEKVEIYVDGVLESVAGADPV